MLVAFLMPHIAGLVFLSVVQDIRVVRDSRCVTSRSKLVRMKSTWLDAPHCASPEASRMDSSRDCGEGSAPLGTRPSLLVMAIEKLLSKNVAGRERSKWLAMATSAHNRTKVPSVAGTSTSSTEAHQTAELLVRSWNC